MLSRTSERDLSIIPEPHPALSHFFYEMLLCRLLTLAPWNDLKIQAHPSLLSLCGSWSIGILNSSAFWLRQLVRGGGFPKPEKYVPAPRVPSNTDIFLRSPWFCSGSRDIYISWFYGKMSWTRNSLISKKVLEGSSLLIQARWTSKIWGWFITPYVCLPRTLLLPPS